MNKQYDNPDFFASYAQMSRSTLGLSGAGEWNQFSAMFPLLKGKAVLDLGCGFGWHCKYAADNGAVKVLGIDQSARMIEEANKRNAADSIEYRVCSLEEYDYPADAFDVVISNLVLHYIVDLNAVYACIFRTLKHGGVFLLNIEHPTFTACVNQTFSQDGTWPVDNYYYAGVRETNFLGHKVIKQHHTLAQIFGGLLEKGFTLERIDEAVPPEQWREQMPEEMKRPMMLLVRATKR